MENPIYTLLKEGKLIVETAGVTDSNVMIRTNFYRSGDIVTFVDSAVSPEDVQLHEGKLQTILIALKRRRLKNVLSVIFGCISAIPFIKVSVDLYKTVKSVVWRDVLWLFIDHHLWFVAAGLAMLFIKWLIRYLLKKIILR